HGTDKNHWFLKEYLDCKRNRKPQIEMEAIKPYVKGRKILDFGSGAGFHASYLKTKGLHIDTTDVIDFRDVVANGLPFELMQTSNRIPYLDNEFDSILAIMVLHHARAQDQQSLLQDLGRIGKRLIIKETTYDLSSLDSKANSFFSEQPIFKQFVSLEVGKQKLAVSLIDLFTNAVASGWSEMSLPFQYRTIPEWKVMLAEANFKLVNIVILGFDPRQVTPDSRIIIVADRKK
ncbi:MAG: class I SAM-dependent methyltransferase, partial [Candidatus Roizmanbacteria bacterium]|nr:class I SAM-dependent methyltransferase [Candidatus Roizmanbacteria bacterium]